MHTRSGTKTPPGGGDGSPVLPGTQALIILGKFRSGATSGVNQRQSGHNGTISSSQRAGLGGKSGTGWYTPFPLQRPQPPAPETLTRAGGNPVQMGRLNPGSLGSTLLPSASPCRLPTSETASLLPPWSTSICSPLSVPPCLPSHVPHLLWELKIEFTAHHSSFQCPSSRDLSPKL